MWGLGVLAILAAVLTVALAGFEYGLPSTRLKRSPNYNDCPPYYPPPHHHHPRFWPPPEFGPPPFGPPPFGPPPFGPPPFGRPDWENSSENRSQGGPSESKSQALTGPKGAEDSPPASGFQSEQSQGKPPCCKSTNSAVSNAQSGTGSAIAVAISGKDKEGK